MSRALFAPRDPMPISATTRPATAGVAPRSIALIAITGAMIPDESPASSDGPYAETATDRRRNAWLDMILIFRAYPARVPAPSRRV